MIKLENYKKRVWIWVILIFESTFVIIYFLLGFKKTIAMIILLIAIFLGVISLEMVLKEIFPDIKEDDKIGNT